MATDTTAVAGADGAVDQQELYGRFTSQQEAKEKLHLRAIHKALNIPEDDDVKINTTSNTSSGIGTGGAIGIATAAGLPSLAAAALMAFSGGSKTATPVVPTTPPAAVQNALADYDIIFHDGKGNILDVPRAPWKPIPTK